MAHSVAIALITLDGQHWNEISPDLTRKDWELPASVRKYRDDPAAKPTRRGVVYALAPSPVDAKRIWAGTDDGLIHTTADGGRHWTDVTPHDLTPWAKVSIIDAGHSDALTAYAAINTLRLDDMRPHILRTHDGGKTWREIVSGIPDGAPVDAVREDPLQKGLLFAGTERAVYVSFDDGDRWQSLRLNMPASSIRDIAIHGDDLVAATHGRGFWILDDITPLRQIHDRVAAAVAYLFKPQTAIRVRWDMNTDTPLPPDEPALPNPPEGAIIDYYLGAAASGPVTLEILDRAGALVRKYSSADPAEPVDPMLAIPAYWVRPPHPLSAAAGMHRFLWDLHYTPLGGGGAGGGRDNYPIQAVVHDTAPAIPSIWVMPAQYTARLTADGKSYQQPLTVKMDPRVKIPAAGLRQQFTLSKQLYDDALETGKALAQLRAVRAQLRSLRDRAGEGAAHDAIERFDQKAAAIEGGGGGGGRGVVSGGPETLASAAGALTSLIRLLQGADATPTATQVAAVADRRAAVGKTMALWTALKTTDLAALNEQLKQANLPAVTQ